jgi:hypothetical protein
MLDTFGLQHGGTQYRRLVSSFQRIFGATIFFGSDTQRARAAVFHQARFSFMTEARIWYSRDPEQAFLPDDCRNVIVLSEEFYREILTHPIPADLEAAKALSGSPAVLDLFMWLSYRSFTARGGERIPLFGDFGLVSQLGITDYARPRKFREKLEHWLDLIRRMWPEPLDCHLPECLGITPNRSLCHSQSLSCKVCQLRVSQFLGFSPCVPAIFQKAFFRRY